MARTPEGQRLSAKDRRRQLVDIGLRLLATRPIHELALDEVAVEAGISRSLLFHYFANKSDFYAAVVERAGAWLLEGGQSPAGETPEERVRSLVIGFLRLVDRTRPTYAALVKGGSGGDPRVAQLLEGVRVALVPRWLAAAGLDADDPDPLTVLAVRGWLAGLEEIALARGSSVDEEDLVDHLVRGFFAQLPVATGSPR